jgi:hypothetical protein
MKNKVLPSIPMSEKEILACLNHLTDADIKQLLIEAFQ